MSFLQFKFEFLMSTPDRTKYQKWLRKHVGGCYRTSITPENQVLVCIEHGVFARKFAAIWSDEIEKSKGISRSTRRQSEWPYCIITEPATKQARLIVQNMDRQGKYRIVCTKRNLQPASTYVFFDSMNDAAMFRLLFTGKIYEVCEQNQK